MSGGGFIQGQGGPGTKATFGFVAGPSGQPNRGHLTVKDHFTGQTVHATVIQQMTACTGGAGASQFLATDQNETTHQVDVTDNGEPSPPTEAFAIGGGGYDNAGTLLGGNNQAHGYSCM
jgi:hypothetical protein